MKFSVLTFLHCIILFSDHLFSQEYKIVKRPEWVNQIEIPKNSSIAKYDISAGFYATLLDYQINLDENAYYTHEVIKVLSYSGITNASQLLVTLDTSYQKLKIHHLYIWRNGVKIDRTSDLSFEIMNNQYNLQDGLYFGKISVYDNLNDIRKDDQIDFAYTVVGKNPIFKNGKYLFLPLELNNPIDLYYTRILYSKEKDYIFKCSDCDSTVNYTNKLLNKYREIIISLTDLKASKLEQNIPAGIIPIKYFSLSSYKSWKDINIWAKSVFTLTTSPNLTSVFKEIFTGTETRDEKINKIINYVQDDIRYMGIESGIGSIKPFSPDQVVKQRFGDCKDKSLLMVSLLKKIGVQEAAPVLVNTEMRSSLFQFFPSNEVFNHCIVNFQVDGSSYWVDPTTTQQGGDYKSSGLQDYGPALVVGQPADSLTVIPALNLKTGVKYKDELFVTSFTQPAKLEIQSTRFGLEADSRRTVLEKIGTAEIAKGLTQDLKLVYPSANQTADVKIKDDMHTNIITNSYQFEVDGFWKDGEKASDKNLAGLRYFLFEPTNLYDYLNMFLSGERKFDYALPYPLNFNYKVIFHFPKEMLVYDNYVKYDNQAFFFDKKIEQLASNSFQVTYNFNIKSASVSAANYLKVYEEKNVISKSLPIAIYFNK